MKTKTVAKKKILLDTREELDITIPAKVALHPHTFLETKVPLTLNLSWLPKHIKVLVLGKDGTWSCQNDLVARYSFHLKNRNELFRNNQFEETKP